MKKIAWGVFITLCAVNLSGCALPEKSKVNSPAATISNQSAPVYIRESTDPKNIEQGISEENIEVVLPSTAYINDRIFEYGRKLERWKELDKQSVTKNLNDQEAVQMVRCFRRLQDVLNGYSEFRSTILQAPEVNAATKITNEDILELQKNDIAFLESTCGSLLTDSEDKSSGWNKPEKGADLNQLETLIDRYAASREYEEIVQIWLNIPESQVGRVQLRSKIVYGNALMYLHQEEKAAEIYQQVVDQMSASDEQATDLVSLRKVLADLYTASGNYRLAATEYKNISNDYLKIGQLEEWSKLQLSLLERSTGGSPELKEYSEILRNFLGFIPERDGYKIIWQTEKFQTSYPYSPVVSNVHLIRDSVTEAADKWFNGFLAEIDKLGNEKKFSKGLRLLEKMPTDVIGAEKQLLIKVKIEELRMAEAVETESGKMAKIQDLQNQWNNGMLLAKDGRYEEALAVFTSLLDTEYSVKAESKIKELSLEAAKAERRKAADLFIRFTKTTDIENKKKLLVESRKLLKNILVKYPEVEIAPKVVGNIERVEQEMNAIDPSLVFMVDQGGVPMDRDVDIERAFAAPGPKTMIGTQVPIIETDLDTPPISQ